jgi:hypothetical protein
VNRDEADDARNHVDHADLVLTVCAYPPEQSGGRIKIFTACTVEQTTPDFVLAMMAEMLIEYGQNMITDIRRNRIARSN